MLLNQFIFKRKFATVIYSKGCGLFGALGFNNNLRDSELFQPVDQYTKDDDIHQISAGWGHSAYLTKSGKVFVFGRPYEFRTLLQQHKFRRFSHMLARFIASASFMLDKNIGFFRQPTIFEEITNASAVQCSGAALTLVTNKAGEVYVFGSNRWGQCGREKDADNPHLSQVIFDPVPVKGINKKVVSIETGLQHCIVLTDKGDVYAWGKHNRGQLGAGLLDADHATAPIQIKTLKDIVSISAGFNHSAAVDKHGIVYVWGKGMSEKMKNEGVVSIQLYEDQLEPRKVQLPGNRVGVEVCCSNFSTVIRASDGTLWSMGIGEHDRNTVSNPIPVEPAGFLDPADDGKDRLIKKYVAPSNMRMKKGHKRVTLLVDLDDTSVESAPASSSNIQNRLKTQVYDVILHNFESYLLPVEMNFSENSYMPTAANTNGYIIKDYSDGWVHTLIILEEIQVE